MRLPRLTRINTIDIYLKGGAILRRDFIKFNIKYSGDIINGLTWNTDDDRMFYVTMSDISAVQTVRNRYRIRFRH
jgi:hypothetical protein